MKGVGAGSGREGATEGVLAKCIGVGEACKHMNEVLQPILSRSRKRYKVRLKKTLKKDKAGNGMER
jgi:hypothetical protein